MISGYHLTLSWLACYTLTCSQLHFLIIFHHNGHIRALMVKKKITLKSHTSTEQNFFWQIWHIWHIQICQICHFITNQFRTRRRRWLGCLRRESRQRFGRRSPDDQYPRHLTGQDCCGYCPEWYRGFCAMNCSLMSYVYFNLAQRRKSGVNEI